VSYYVDSDARDHFNVKTMEEYVESALNLVLSNKKTKRQRVDYIRLVFLLVLSTEFSALWRDILPSLLLIKVSLGMLCSTGFAISCKM